MRAKIQRLPRVERARAWRFGFGTQCWFAQESRRKRSAAGTSVVESVSGLKLWLVASKGTYKAWDAVPVSGSGSIDYGSGTYEAYNQTHAIRVHAYKMVGGVQKFAPNYLEVSATDNGSTNFYTITWFWDAVAGADGYRVFKEDPVYGLHFDHYLDTADTSLWDTGPQLFTPGTTVTPQELSSAGADEAVFFWEDQSGNNHHAKQNIGGRRPVLKSGMVNGKPVLRLNGTNGGMVTGLTLGSNITVFAVYACNSGASTARRAVQGENNWLLGPYHGQYVYYSGISMLSGPVLVAGQFVVQTGWQNDVLSRNYVNGTLASEQAGETLGPGLLSLGAAGAFNEPLEGDIAEVVVYEGAISDADRAAVEGYLKGEYGIGQGGGVSKEWGQGMRRRAGRGERGDKVGGQSEGTKLGTGRETRWGVIRWGREREGKVWRWC